MRELTGNYYKNNDFSKVSAQIELVTEEVTAIIGQKIYKKAEKAYTENSEDKDIQKLIRKIQHPIAIMATLRMYQRNDLSHEDDGRKFKIDGVNENYLGNGNLTGMMNYTWKIIIKHLML